MQIFGRTDRGIKRSTNQDAFATGVFSDDTAWAIVCDGMGGANGGNIASQTVVESVSTALKQGYRKGMSEASYRNLLESAITLANTKVYDIAKGSDGLEGMGTTVVVALFDKNTAYFAHAGDSRAYLIDKEGLMQITRDHSIVQTMIESGKLTSEEAKNHPNKNVITRALGVDAEVEAEYDSVDLNDETAILLCTDGLTNYVNNETIVSIIAENEAQMAVEILVETANGNGGGDNITAVLFKRS